MWKLWGEDHHAADLRLVLYTGAKQFLLILAAGLFIKLLIFDSLKVNGSQMDPAVRAGDRVLLFKAPYVTPVIKNFTARAGKPVVISLADKSANTALRIAAVSGDTVSIRGGQMYRNGAAAETFFKDTEKYGLIPAEYSPNDFMNALKVPAPGDSILFGTLSMHDLIFAYSVFRQETQGVRLIPYVMVDDITITGEYPVRDFALYSGRLDSIPEEMHADWFFWDRLQGYLDMTSEEGKNPKLAFTVWKNGKEATGFKVRKKYLFLLGDNWNGAKDSRHFGPIAQSNIKGRPLMTLWGYIFDDNGKKKLDAGRIMRFIK
jgi:signal peptidase I